MTNNISYQSAYNEALELAEMARAMIMLDRQSKNNNKTSYDDIKTQLAKIEVTARLASIISWSMYQKAVDNGEITKEEALENCSELFTLKKDIIKPSVMQGLTLSENLKKLIEKSSNLYSRVLKVDEMMRH